MAKDKKSKKIISTNIGDSSKKSSTKKIVETSSKGKKKNSLFKSKANLAQQETAKGRAAKAERMKAAANPKSEATANSPKRSIRSSRATKAAVMPTELLFNRNNYMMIALAFGLIMLGMILMMGGGMPDSNTWDESLIYSTRRTLIAPIVILIGLIVGVYSIFRD